MAAFEEIEQSEADNDFADDGAEKSGDVGQTNGAAAATEKPQAPSDTIAALQEKRGRGRPKLTEEEKARRALERATRKAETAGVPADILEKYAAVNAELATKPVNAPPRKPPTKEQISKAEKAVTKSAAFLGGVIYELFSAEPTLEFKDDKAESLGEAWGELLAEYVGESAGTIIPLVVAVGVTGHTVVSSVKEIRKHNAEHKKREDVKNGR